jgi:hypothetical protein
MRQAISARLATRIFFNSPSPRNLEARKAPWSVTCANARGWDRI